MIGGKKETMAFLMSGCHIISVIIVVGDIKNELEPLVETQDGFIANWLVKYDRPQPNEFEVFKETGTNFQLIAGIDCQEALFATWFVALSNAGVSFTALDSDSFLISK